MTRRLTISVLAAFLGAVAWPVYGYFQAHSFFNASDKYQQWYREASSPGAVPAPARTADAQPAPTATTVADRYPYPEKKFVLTEEQWRDATRAVEYGRPDWYDSEIVRQRAEIEEHAPAMDLLGWMYEHGRGLGRDYRKAFTWYERAKLAGEIQLRGDSTQIFDRLTPPEQFIAQLQLAEDIQRMNPEAADEIEKFESVNLHVFKQQRELDTLRRKSRAKKRETKAIHR